MVREGEASYPTSMPNGITTISSDLNAMGKSAADMILTGASRHIANPFSSDFTLFVVGKVPANNMPGLTICIRVCDGMGGPNGGGYIYEWEPVSNTFDIRYNFDEQIGSMPYSRLVGKRQRPGKAGSGTFGVNVRQLKSRLLYSESNVE